MPNLSHSSHANKPRGPHFDKPSATDKPFNLLAALQTLKNLGTSPNSVVQLNNRCAPVITIPYTMAAFSLVGAEAGQKPSATGINIRFEAIISGCRVQWFVSKAELEATKSRTAGKRRLS